MIIAEHSCGSRVTIEGNASNQCVYCHAKLWPSELPSIFCNNGKTKLQYFPEPPEYLKNLWQSNKEEPRIFRQHIRVLNNALALASQKVHEVRPHGGGWAPSVVIQGKVNQFVGPINAEICEQPR